MRTKIFKLIFWFSIIFIGISLWTITAGQKINYEFQNSTISNIFYNTIFSWLPFVILLTLFGSLKKRYDTLTKTTIVILTSIFSIVTFIFLFNSMFTLGFGIWVTESIIYQNKLNRKTEIRSQIYDVGAFGYGKRRIVKVDPFSCLFYKVTEIDTNRINKTEWKLVNKDIMKFP